ncbi:hypothetical protein F4553_005124 [Allocatelliglobosispora scoriae]|uniref:Uncharacterized protein n=1 Tax=Allocatelliglobosispora scoriae TaxID=643052 RepID=A0A841BVP0_9ACTN|nr:hypothetical protein [Allocatelliglobosispora scoriae]
MASSPSPPEVGGRLDLDSEQPSASLHSDPVRRERVDLSIVVEKGDLRCEMKARGAFQRAAEFAVITMVTGVLVAGAVSLCIWAQANGVITFGCAVVVGVGVPAAGWWWTGHRR